MRKLIALFSVLFIVLFAFDTYAITIPPQFNDEITGPSTVCTGTVGNYTLVMENCFVSILDIQTTSNGILTTLPSFPTDLNQFSVQWFNNGSTITTGRIDVVVWFYPGQCPNPAGPIPPASTKTVSLTVTIEPGNPMVTAPSAISSSLVYTESLLGFQADAYYRFETSAANVDGFQWTVTGGNISDNNGDNIEVEANSGSCQLNVGVRAFKQNCTGSNSFSSTRNTIYNIPIPQNPGSIAGNPSVVSGSSIPSSYAIAQVSEATSYEWRIVGSSEWRIGETQINIPGFPTQGIPPSGTNANVFYDGCCFSIATLYVKSLNSCGESLSENSINLTASPILSSSSQVYPNPVRSGQSVRLSTSNQSIGQVINVKNENGRLIGTYNLSKNHSEIVINGLKKGSYFVEFRSNEDVRTERLIVLD